MTDFHDVAFPLPLAFGARGGPQRRTDIVRLASGYEHRNSPHAYSTRQYNAGAGVKSLTDIHTLISFFEARQGQRFAFRFRDPMDHLSCNPGSTISASDQTIGVGDGVRTEFSLFKTYEDVAGLYVRPITKPVSGTVLVAIDGNMASPLIDFMTGQVIFVTAPATGASITAGYQFDVPVRFDTDRLNISLEAFGAGQVLDIPLLEVNDHA